MSDAAAKFIKNLKNKTSNELRSMQYLHALNNFKFINILNAIFGFSWIYFLFAVPPGPVNVELFAG